MGPRSLVIDELKGDREDSKPKIGLAYLYCDYNDPVQTVQEVICAMVKQLLNPLDVIPEEIVQIYERLRNEGQPIGLEDAKGMLLHACKPFVRVYVCIDALDELEEKERDKLLESLQGLPLSVHLFITGRDPVKTTVQCYFRQAVKVPIEAKKDDIINLIEDEISKSCQKNSNLMDETLKRDITEQIVAKFGGKLVTSFPTPISPSLTTL